MIIVERRLFLRKRGGDHHRIPRRAAKQNVAVKRFVPIERIEMKLQPPPARLMGKGTGSTLDMLDDVARLRTRREIRSAKREPKHRGDGLLRPRFKIQKRGGE
ncbi:hypothetical protein SDC9_170782 [bioreactor metagenome]|uniref:Uncharacterized protein n=1 Tax=bioreactor metagenome TaxID=1076179 RepID=A0A645GHR6_9ZZZZ